MCMCKDVLYMRIYVYMYVYWYVCTNVCIQLSSERPEKLTCVIYVCALFNQTHNAI
jgi:hypothetical protein